MRVRPLAPLVCVLALVATACGAGAPSTDDDASGATVTANTAGVEVTGDPGQKPEISVPEGDTPPDLVIADLIEGDGEEVPAGAVVTTHYVGVSWTLDRQFDSSWDRGQPLQFGLDQVISGWAEGIPGMRVGGRRLLVIPPDQAYGQQSPTPDIAPNDTLVFVIDLIDFGGPSG
jgi:peptidylprolyl isomerase